MQEAISKPNFLVGSNENLACRGERHSYIVQDKPTDEIIVEMLEFILLFDIDIEYMQHQRTQVLLI